MTFGAAYRRWPAGGGSCTKTSTAAPAICPSPSARASAASSTLAPAHVDQVGRPLHRGELARADHVPGLSRQRRAHHDDVRAGEQVGQLGRREPRVRQAALGIAGAGRAVAVIIAARRIPLARQHAHRERGLGDAGEFAADRAVADDAEGRPAHRCRHEQRPALLVGRPHAPSLPLDHARHAMRQRQEDRHRVFGDGRRVHSARGRERERGVGVERVVVQPVHAGHVHLDPLQARRPGAIARQDAGVEDLRARVIGRLGLGARHGETRRDPSQPGELPLAERRGHQDVRHGYFVWVSARRVSSRRFCSAP